MPIRGEGLVEEGADQQQEEEKVSFVLHPNCGIFDDE